jgi:cytochrome c oxidase cbb3-type subunit 3
MNSSNRPTTFSNRPPVAPEGTADTMVDLFAGGATYELTSHDYDGIQEYDNPLPGWWKWLFVATVLFSFPYFAFFHFGAEGRTLADMHSSAVAANARLQFKDIGELAGDEQTILKYMQDQPMVRYGQSVYRANCVSCHGLTGGGIVGPNLTDNEYKGIKTVADLYRVITNGAAAGAMPAWQNRLQQNDRVLAAVYVATLRGTDPGGTAKPPEGKTIAPWPEYVPEVGAEGTQPPGDPSSTGSNPIETPKP